MKRKERQEVGRSFQAPPLVFLERLTSRRNAIFLARLLFVFAVMVVLYTIIFHFLMEMEGQEHTWLTGIYWVFTTMTTLGLGDVYFVGDLGKMFTTLVLLSGVFFLLALLPFTIFQLFQSTARVPRELPYGTRGHVILTQHNPATTALIRTLDSYFIPYVLVLPDLTQTANLRDRGIRAVTGDLSDPETYRQVRAGGASLLATTDSDVSNTSITYAVRQASESVPIVATCTMPESREVLRLAGATHLIMLDELIGQSLARRTIAGDALAHVIGYFDQLVIAEAMAAGTPLVGKTLEEARLRESVGVTAVGIWERGVFHTARAATKITNKTVLVMAGSQAQIDAYNELFCIYNVTSAPVLIVGGGNIGRAVGDALALRDLDFRIIDRQADRLVRNERMMVGEPTDQAILQQAGIDSAPAIAITTPDDELNIYLATLYRHLRPDIQIISRASIERSVQPLHAAGCDFVISYASMGAKIIFNLLKRGNILMLAEGVDAFRVKVPGSLAGKRIGDTSIRKETGCSIIGVGSNSTMVVNPNPETVLPEQADIVLLGTVESELRFLKKYGAGV